MFDYWILEEQPARIDIKLTHLIFIGPRSDHSLRMSVTNSLTNELVKPKQTTKTTKTMQNMQNMQKMQSMQNMQKMQSM